MTIPVAVRHGILESDDQRKIVERSYSPGVDSVAGLVTIESERDVAQGTLAGARLFSNRCGRSGDIPPVLVHEFANSPDNYDLWEIDLDAPISPTRLTNTTGAVTKSITTQEQHPNHSPNDSQMVFRVQRKGGRDGGFIVEDVGTYTTQTKLIECDNVRDPAWRPVCVPERSERRTRQRSPPGCTAGASGALETECVTFPITARS